MSQPEQEIASVVTQTEARESVQFHVLSFEGADACARAGGLASRISGLTEALAASGHETHVWSRIIPLLCHRSW